MESPATFCFTNNGQQIATGGFRSDRMLQIFDMSRPGRDATTILKLGKTRRSKDGQKGLVSALSFSPGLNLLAVGTYSPGSIYLYDARAQSTPANEIVISGNCIVGHGKSHSRKRKHFTHDEDSEQENLIDFSAAKVKWFHSRARGGVTQLEFSEDMYSLYSSSRRANAILQWDLRKLATSTFVPGLATFGIDNDTNQRMEFHLHGEHIFAGGRDKSIAVYNCKQSNKMVAKIDGFHNAVNGVSVSSLGKKTILASASGSRYFPSESELDDDEDDEGSKYSNKSIGNNRGGDIQLYGIKI
jgi:WD40 repeat protein